MPFSNHNKSTELQVMPSPCIKERTDVSTQTFCPSPTLPSDLSDVLSGRSTEENNSAQNSMVGRQAV